MTPPPQPLRASHHRWQTWLGLFVLLPLGAACCALVYLLYRHVVTGELSTVAKGYRSVSRTIVFADSPATFLLYFVMHALFVAAVIIVTVVLARVTLQRFRARP